MDVAAIISSYEQSRERDIERKLACAEMQLYGEIPLAPQRSPTRPWDAPTGSSEAISQWREKVVGKAILPADQNAQVELTDVESDDEEDTFWTATCNFPIASHWDGEAVPEDALPVVVLPVDADGADRSDEGDMPLVYDDSVIYSATRQGPADASFSPGFEPDLSLCVRGCRPPLRDRALVDEMEEIICANGVYDDYLALSRWPETEAVSDPDDEFPPFVILSVEEAAARVRASLQEAIAQACTVAAGGSDNEGSGDDEDSGCAKEIGKRIHQAV